MEALAVLVWGIWTAGCAYIAAERGRSPFAWGVIALVLSPLFAYLMLIAVPVRADRRREVEAAIAESDGALRAAAKASDGPIFPKPR